MPTRVEETLPYLTHAVAGIGGVIRTTPEDFRVEEKPLYLPCGEGEHLYLSITKRGLSTPQLVSRISSTLAAERPRRRARARTARARHCEARGPAP